ncbi:MAG: KH domain-containing protein [Candidatus Cloacimonadota bacterium]|nr:MAG: KH domain-containing protein [Candidatus Cloacimonadota bacterium]
MKELVELIAKALVDSPEMVQVQEIQGEKTTVFELRVGSGDLGKIIGKEGRTAKSIRTIITAASMKAGKRAVLEILE